jgi:hypothetical protein
MVRERRQENIEYMGIEARIPIVVTIENVKLAKRRVFSFIPPCESAVLQVDFMELKSLRSGPEVVDAATIDVCLVLVPSSPNLVAVTKDQPPHTKRWLLSHKLHEEAILPRACIWPIDRHNLEISITRRVDDVHIGRKAKFGRKDI